MKGSGPPLGPHKGLSLSRTPPVVGLRPPLFPLSGHSQLMLALSRLSS